MDDISSILSSLDEKDISKLKDMAESIFGEGEKQEQTNPGIDLSAAAGLIGKLNAEDDNIRFLRSLKPVLSDKRKRKADEAINIMRIIKLMPALRESGLFGDVK